MGEPAEMSAEDREDVAELSAIVARATIDERDPIDVFFEQCAEREIDRSTMILWMGQELTRLGKIEPTGPEVEALRRMATMQIGDYFPSDGLAYIDRVIEASK